jgi:glutathione S-transferase
VITLYHAPLSRSVRIVWLLEELGLPYELRAAALEPPAPRPFAQKTPSGKVPTLEDDGIATACWASATRRWTPIWLA